MSMIDKISVMTALLALAACSAHGPDQVISPSGPTNINGTGTIASFKSAYDSAAATSASASDAYSMVRIGTELDYQLCADFFRTAGREQQWLLFGKDTLATLGTLTAGVLGAAGASSTSVAWVGLSSAAGISSVNLYERNFLFSEDNVQAVQDLTLKAVSAAREQALAPERQNSYTFASGVSALMDVQAVCEVQNILVMVRKAITQANPQGTVSGTDTASANVIKARLGEILSSGIQISDSQLQSLYWLFAYSPAPTTTQRQSLYGNLSGLTPSPIKSDGSDNAEFSAKADQVRRALQGLPASVVAQISANIQKAAAGGGTRSLRGEVLNFPPLSMSTGSLGHIGVDIR